MSDWYYAVDNEQKGPISEAELKSQLNKLPADTLVWKEGMDNWTPASQMPALTFREPAPPVKLASATAARNPESVSPVTVSSLVGPGEALEVDPEDAENYKIYGILAYLSILFIVPMTVMKKSPFAKYHANQGLVLFLVEIALGIVVSILDEMLYMVHLGYLSLIFGLLWLGVVVLLIIGIINAAAGKCLPLPIIGKFSLIK